ncbi:MAG: hypothetical protein L0Y58_11495, partial [Verrucomicrobia subdivision 3 bacterium]|nr:hypothetical protein [Limisphaerales bacterium]
YQEVVDHFKGRIQFVQVGGASDYHPKLNGTIDLRGRTAARELLQLIYHCQGIVCAVTGPMHLAAAVEVKDKSAGLRPCVVVAGGREPVHWEAYPGHQFIHTIGALPCCARGGCWRTRTVALGDGSPKDRPEELCVDVRGGLPHCMDLIRSAEVIRRIESYFEGGVLKPLTPAQARAGARAARRMSNNPVDHAPLTLPNARYAADRLLKNIAPYPADTYKGRGIVMCAESISDLAQAWIGINMLRQLGCRLPIQLWHAGAQGMDASMKSLLRALRVECVNALDFKEAFRGKVAKGPPLKPYAVLRSPFQHVLLLDPAMFAVADPSYLFETREFQKHGAMLWPGGASGAIPPQTWLLCGLEPSSEPPVAISPMLVDKEKAWAGLSLWWWYHENGELFYGHTDGGKHTMHLAVRRASVAFAVAPRVERNGFSRYDCSGKLVFRRREEPWNLIFGNGEAPRSRWEREAHKWLDELRRRWKSHAVPARHFQPAEAPEESLVRSPARRSFGTRDDSRSREPFSVVTLHDEPMAKVGRITARSLCEYARCQNYRFVYHDRLIDPARHPSWNKVLAVRNALVAQRAGWAMWVDADAMVMNHRIRAESLIPKGCDLVFASDFNGLVAGIFMIRYCEWSIKFLDTVFFLGDLNHDPDGCGPKWEQNTIKYILKNFAGFAERVAVLPKRHMNSDLATYQPGDFMLHLGVTANGNRERTFREAEAWIVR